MCHTILRDVLNIKKGLKILGLKLLKIEAVCSVGVVPANGDCQRGNELKFINEIATGDPRMFRNCDIASCEIQTEDMGTPPPPPQQGLTYGNMISFAALLRKNRKMILKLVLNDTEFYRLPSLI